MGTSAFRLGASQASGTNFTEVISQAGHGFAAGDVVRPTDSGGVFALAQANSVDNAEGIGVISEVNVNTFTVVYSGVIVSGALNGYNSGDVLFLSDLTAGKLTTTPPTLPGTVIKTVVVMTGDTGEAQVVNYVGSVIGGEASVSVTNLQPVGAIAPYGGHSGSVPIGWLNCDGLTYADTSFPDLYEVIGTSFGGSAANHEGLSGYFAVPDMQGRVTLGGGTGSGLTVRTLGETGGIEIITDPIPQTNGVFDHTSTATGNTAALANLPPFLVTNYIIRHEKNSRASISGLLASDLADTGISGPTSGEFLQYEGNGQTGKWENVSVAQAVGSSRIAPPELSAGVTAGYPYRVLDSGGVSGGVTGPIDDSTNYRWTGLRITTSGHTGSDKIWLQGNLIMYMDTQANSDTRLFDFGIYSGGIAGLTAGAPQVGSLQYSVLGVGQRGFASPGDTDGATVAFPISFIHMIGTGADVNYDIAVRAGQAGLSATILPSSTYYAMNLYG